MKLAEQWAELLERLPRGWQTARLTLTLDDEGQAARASLILGPAAPGRSGSIFRITVDRGGRGPSPGPELTRRVLARLDAEGIRGRLEPVEAEEPGEGAAEERPAPGGLAAQWDRVLEDLPPDWSHLYAQVDLDSSDFVERGALLLAPTNPLLSGGPRSFRFRAAQKVGYGVASRMARRCLERLDHERITGRVRVLRVVSDDHPVATQGPVWRIGGRAV